jgi:predicted Rossmann fold flavoprotein
LNRVIIIGAGASGLMAAICAARSHASVTVLEHNDKPGRKLLASGNGKCNLTNLRVGIENYHTEDPELIRRCLSRFPVSETLRFFRELGLQFRDRDGWIYPSSDQSSAVLQVLLMEAQHLHVKIKTQEEVTGIQKEADGSFQVSTETWHYPADRVILSCGSPASAVRGSSDTAQRIGQSLGLATVPFLPSLVPLKIREPFSSKWGGCRVHAAISLLVDGKEVSSDCGEIQLTESGISGIPVFQVSHDAVLGLAKKKKTEAVLNFWPDGGTEGLLDTLCEVRKNSPWKTEEQLLAGLLPDKLIPVLTGICKKKRGSSPDLLRSLAVLVCHFPVTIAGSAGIRQAQVCSGGISTKELTDDLMCRRIPGLYVTGEALNVDGLCGGNCLQLCWSTGCIAGCSAAASLHNS